MRILVTGDRNWTDYDRVLNILKQIPGEGHTLVHGGASGADTMAGSVAVGFLDWDVEVYVAEWTKYGRAAGPMRNQEMVESEPDICIAFHTSIATSKGTKSCVIKCIDKNIHTWLVDQFEVSEVLLASKDGGVRSKPVIWHDVCIALSRKFS